MEVAKFWFTETREKFFISTRKQAIFFGSRGGLSNKFSAFNQ